MEYVKNYFGRYIILEHRIHLLYKKHNSFTNEVYGLVIQVCSTYIPNIENIQTPDNALRGMMLLTVI